MTISLLPELVIEAIQTTAPTNVTSPKTSFKVSTLNTFNHNSFNKYGHIILYYKKLGSEESGWFHGGWIKDTLGRAMLEQPMLSGRLRRGEDGFEIVSNDSGVRVIEARVPVSLEEFLDSVKRNEREVASALLHCKDVDEENFQFTSLLHIQVTNFQCGGYSIGISHNLLLVDPFFIESFMQKWAEIHKNAIFASNIPKMPLFYLPNIKRIGNPLPQLLMLKPSKDISTNVAMFEVSIVGDPSFNACNSIALQCIEEAESKVGIDMTQNFTLIVKRVSGDVKVDVTSKPSLSEHVDGSKYAMKCLGWDDLGTNGVAFWQGNAPTLVSHYVGSVGREGLVLLVISRRDNGKLGMNVIVTFPS